MTWYYPGRRPPSGPVLPIPVQYSKCQGGDPSKRRDRGQDLDRVAWWGRGQFLGSRNPFSEFPGAPQSAQSRLAIGGGEGRRGINDAAVLPGGQGTGSGSGSRRGSGAGPQCLVAFASRSPQDGPCEGVRRLYRRRHSRSSRIAGGTEYAGLVR